MTSAPSVTPDWPVRKKDFMPEMREEAVSTLDPAQAAELSLLVDLEAHWENLRKASPPVQEQSTHHAPAGFRVRSEGNRRST